MDLQITQHDRVLTIRMNRPARKNALTRAMYSQMAEALQQADADPQIRAVLLVGDATIFSSGNDLEDFMKEPPMSEDAPVGRFLNAIRSCETPIVASVRGAAVGVGTTMLLHCDLVYAGDDARFATPFTNLGLCPEAASSLLMTMVCGLRHASEKLLLGEFFDADEAVAMGLVNRKLPADQVEAYALAQAIKLTALPPRSIRETKRFLKEAQADLVAQRMRDESNLFKQLLIGPEAREAFAAFFEKRKPDFSRFE